MHGGMSGKFHRLALFLRDQAGQVTIEWSLLIAAFGIPMILLFWLMLSTLVGHYRMIVCILSMPLP